MRLNVYEIFSDLRVMRVHFIAIGGSAMHNLAMALNRKGLEVSGSDDEIFEPSKGRLLKEGIYPKEMGWDAKRITADIDAVILGMHARADNPELVQAQKMGLQIYSYPEFIYSQTKDKKRIVVGGSHGKTNDYIYDFACDGPTKYGNRLFGWCIVRGF